MKQISLLTLLLFTTLLQAQDPIYSDAFDGDVLSVGGNTNGYTLTLNDGAFRLSGNGSAGSYEATSYNFHDGAGIQNNIDATSSTKLYIRAKAENSPSLRIDLEDNTGYVTNLNSVAVNLSDEFEIYELNYTGKLQDGAYAGPCTSGPCDVDASDLVGLVFFVNDANGGYSGNIDIDWLSIGAPLEAIPDPPAYDIRYNQVSYIKGRDKILTLASANPISPQSYSIINSNGDQILAGVTQRATIWNPSREYVSNIDASSLNNEDKYTLITPELSIDFNVSHTGYEELSKASLKYYYYNRASIAIESQYGGDFARPFGHPDDDVRIHASAATSERPEGTIISAPKGWYDAGDYNKYIVNSGISTYTLLAAYEHFPDYYNALSLNIPEQGGDLPDVLDEVLWNLEWMLDMQDPNDGGVYHKLTGLNFSGIVMPDQYDFQRYVVQKTTAATLNFAAVCASASRIFSAFESAKPGFSAQLLDAAKSAYAWAKANPTIYYNQPSNVQTGAYGDGNVSDEFRWAASELFITSKENTYADDINLSNIGNNVPGWNSVDALALISLSYFREELGNAVNVDNVDEKLISRANNLKDKVNNSTIRLAMDDGDFFWGSNGHAGNQIVMLIRAYEINGDESYLNAAYTAMDYLLGRNGSGYCYVTGFGDKPTLRPHHRISEADAVAAPVPGMVAGGPNPGQQDNCSGYPNNYPASSYTDEWCSYASNEVTINWNAPLAYAINALQYYQNERVGLSTSTKNIVKTDIYLSPNPAHNQLQINSTEAISGQYEIYNISGQKVLSGRVQNSNYIDVNGLDSGMYIFNLKDGVNVHISKFMKM